MLYLVYVLTFLAGILFFIYSPRDDQPQLDTYRAEGFIVSFLTQHQASKDYFKQWLQVSPPVDGTPVESPFYIHNRSGIFPYWVTGGMSKAEIYADNDVWNASTAAGSLAGSPGFVTTVFCINDVSGAKTVGNCSPDSQVYVATYAGLQKPSEDLPYMAYRPEWWPSEQSNRQRRYGSWRLAIARRTDGSPNCGVLRAANIDRAAQEPTCSGGQCKWCIDNGQKAYGVGSTDTCVKEVPDEIIAKMGCQNAPRCEDTFFCLSKIKQGPDAYYISDGLAHFYDGINNLNQGIIDPRHESTETRNHDNNAAWMDMKGSADSAVTADFSSSAMAANVTNSISFGSVVLTHPFSVTLLLQAGRNASDSPLSVFGVNIGESDGNYAFDNGGGTPKVIQVPFGQKISVTFISQDENNTLNMYVGAGTRPVLQNITLTDKPKLTLNVNAGPGAGANWYLYGVRVYNKALSVERKAGRINVNPSELEHNFKVDAVRYGLVTPSESDYQPHTPTPPEPEEEPEE